MHGPIVNSTLFSAGDCLYPLPTRVLFTSVHSVIVVPTGLLLGRIKVYRVFVADALAHDTVVLIGFAEREAADQRATGSAAKHRSKRSGLDHGQLLLQTKRSAGEGGAIVIIFDR